MISSMLEKNIEAKVLHACRKQGILNYKFVSPGNRGVPDRLLIGRKGNVAFLEFKRQGEKPDPLQRRMLKIFSDRGCFAGYVDSYREACMFIANFIAWDQKKG